MHCQHVNLILMHTSVEQLLHDPLHVYVCVALPPAHKVASAMKCVVTSTGLRKILPLF